MGGSEHFRHGFFRDPDLTKGLSRKSVLASSGSNFDDCPEVVGFNQAKVYFLYPSSKTGHPALSIGSAAWLGLFSPTDSQNPHAKFFHGRPFDNVDVPPQPNFGRELLSLVF